MLIALLMSMLPYCASEFVSAGVDLNSPAVVASFSYDAVDSQSKRRRQPTTKLTSEDDALNGSQRRRMVSTTRDLSRNFALASWAIRKHLDFVSNFYFSSNNAQVVPAGAKAERKAMSELDDAVELIIATAATAERCDAAGRHDLSSMLRLNEARATIDGDCGLMKIQEGTIQGLEGDRIRTPGGESEDVVHGVRTNKYGRAIEYALHSRKGTTLTFERWVPAQNIWMRGYYDRFDQLRGISPMAPALNTLRDLYENFDLALAKVKISQLFGLVTIRGGLDALGNPTVTEINGRKEYSVDLGKGPFQLDLDPGDKADILESKTPSSEFQDYSEMMIAVSLLSLDLPWNFYKVDATNFFGSRAAVNLYLQSAKPKRAANKRILYAWTRWQLQLAILRGELKLPRGMTVDDLKWSWTPDGIPWWNPSQEADGALKSIGAGLDNPQRIALETGTNAFDNIDKTAEVVDYAKTKGLTLSFSPAPAFTIQAGQQDQRKENDQRQEDDDEN